MKVKETTFYLFECLRLLHRKFLLSYIAPTARAKGYHNGIVSASAWKCVDRCISVILNRAFNLEWTDLKALSGNISGGKRYYILTR